MGMDAVAASASSLSSGERGLFVVAGLIGTWWVIHFFFHRVIGGNQAKGGGPGGSEKDIVGVIVLLAAIFVGIMMATGKGSAAHSEHTRTVEHPSSGAVQHTRR
jgi:hypothetical protein